MFKTGYLEQLIQLVTATWDGDLICKSHRDELVKCGYVDRVNGYNVINSNGIIVLVNLGVLRP